LVHASSLWVQEPCHAIFQFPSRLDRACQRVRKSIMTACPLPGQ
jgi:hypothetical protein